MTQTFTGRACYYPDHWVGPYRLPIAVECIVGGLPFSAIALLDTGSDWCVMSREIGEALNLDTTPDPSTPPLSSRFGVIFGRLERETVRFLADEGEPLDVEATWFISSDWHGPLVIGWKGCLERMRSASDPSGAEDLFYFAALRSDVP